jgi:hypothetical protein
MLLQQWVKLGGQDLALLRSCPRPVGLQEEYSVLAPFTMERLSECGLADWIRTATRQASGTQPRPTE